MKYLIILARKFDLRFLKNTQKLLKIKSRELLSRSGTPLMRSKRKLTFKRFQGRFYSTGCKEIKMRPNKGKHKTQRKTRR